jgi:hypothetical protein
VRVVRHLAGALVVEGHRGWPETAAGEGVEGAQRLAHRCRAVGSDRLLSSSAGR